MVSVTDRIVHQMGVDARLLHLRALPSRASRRPRPPRLRRASWTPFLRRPTPHRDRPRDRQRGLRGAPGRRGTRSSNRGGRDAVTWRPVGRASKPSGGQTEFVDTVVDVLDLSASVALVPLAPFPNACRGQRSNPGGPGQVTNHGPLKRAVKRENHPFPSTVGPLSGGKAHGAVLEGRQDILPFVGVQISDHWALAFNLGMSPVHHLSAEVRVRHRRIAVRESGG